ncbi:MAG: protein kinase [Bacteroidetes bacterium]|nr:protein kinase [Bacteroidota bacterium]
MAEDSFTVLELISQSPTTSVYKAHQNVLDRTVLLKVLHKHLFKDKELVARFSREAKACAILHSENIVQVYDLTEVEGAPAIVMEYVEGKSLDEALLDQNIRSEQMLMRVAVSVLNALAYAHERGVIHRDIKPGNILVSAAGIIKVTDFGLASLSGSPSLTIDGTLIGTPAYMSPEQSRGETVDNRTDLFSLGVTLVEIITGERILAGRSYAECINKIQAFDPDSLDALNVSPHVLAFLKRLLAPDKNERFASANEVLQFLSPEAATGIADGGAGQRQSSGKGSGAESKRKKLLAAGIAIVFVLVLGLSFLFRHPAQVVEGNRPGLVAADTASGQVADRGSSPVRTSTAAGAAKESSVRKNEIAGGSPSGVKQVPTFNSETKDKVGSVSPLVAADSGYISIACTPWAKIFIDNEYAGMTPIFGSIKVPAGTHTVTFNNPDFVPIVKEVRVRSRVLANVDADFLGDAGYIFVHVDPWGHVYVDDQLRETTPSTKPIIVSAGTRHLRIENPAFHDILRDLNVKPGDTLRLNFSFLKGDEN